MKKYGLAYLCRQRIKMNHIFIPQWIPRFGRWSTFPEAVVANTMDPWMTTSRSSSTILQSKKPNCRLSNKSRRGSRSHHRAKKDFSWYSFFRDNKLGIWLKMFYLVHLRLGKTETQPILELKILVWCQILIFIGANFAKQEEPANETSMRRVCPQESKLHWSEHYMNRSGNIPQV